ncbi:MAG: hypothetical protein M3R06_04125, partial [Chloroflexota bacterium]|nr:hypothetical protein [Chloroflexota bacterium]
ARRIAYSQHRLHRYFTLFLTLNPLRRMLFAATPEPGTNSIARRSPPVVRRVRFNSVDAHAV